MFTRDFWRESSWNPAKVSDILKNYLRVFIFLGELFVNKYMNIIDSRRYCNKVEFRKWCFLHNILILLQRPTSMSFSGDLVFNMYVSYNFWLSFS